DVRLTARPLVRRLGSQRRVPAELLHRVQHRELLADRRIRVLAELLGKFHQTLRGRGAATPGAAGTHLADVVAGTGVELSGDRSGERIARPAGTAGAEPRTLGHQRRVRGGPTVVQTTDDVIVAHARAVDEDLVEHRAPGHLAKRPDLHTWLAHVELEVRDALVL